MRKFFSLMCVMAALISCGGSEEPVPTAVEQLPVVETPPPPEIPAAPAIVETPAQPPEPGPADADGDGVPDSADNCVSVANADQANTDAATESVVSGDACDDDDDGDGLTDEEETALGKDMVITDPGNPDTDGDGVHDGADNCPKATNAKQEDADADGFGEACDCDDANASTNPAAADDPDITYLDRNCDGVDGDRLKAVFVSNSGDDTNNGSINSPVAAVQRALDIANGKDVYIAQGVYFADGIVWPQTIRVFGGYATTDAAKPFGAREVRVYKSRFVGGGPVALSISPPAVSITLDGIFIEGEGGPALSSVVQVSNSSAVIRYSTILGNTKSDVTYGVVAGDGAQLLLDSNWVNPRGADGTAASIGVLAAGGDTKLFNNIIVGGYGNETEGLVINGAKVTAIHNTIDGGSAGNTSLVARSVRVADAAPVLQNNLLMTSAGTQDQAVLWCSQGDATGAAVSNNIFATFPSGQYDPLLVDCLGQFYFDAASLSLSGATVVGNIGYGGNVGGLVNGSYGLAGVTGVGSADAAASLLMADSDDVVRDFAGKERKVPYDIGAIETD